MVGVNVFGYYRPQTKLRGKGAYVAGRHAWHGGGVCVARGGGGVRGRREGHCSGRYASYWNAFLSLMIRVLQNSCLTSIVVFKIIQTFLLS